MPTTLPPTADADYHRRLALNGYSGTARSATGDLRYLVRFGIFLLVLALLGALAYTSLWNGFLANPLLNGTILALLAFGIGYTLKGLFAALNDARAVHRAASAVDKARAGLQSHAEVSERILSLSPNGIGPFLNKVQRVVTQGDAAATLPYLLDSLATRADDRRALVRYLIGALVLLGLIGTFYGLLETLGGVREVLGGFASSEESDTLTLLAGLQERLARPLGGMGMAFSSSLFGLLASLILAFLELQLFHAQNDVHADLESLVVSELVPFWRSPAAVGRTPAPGATLMPEYVVSLLETTAERLDRMIAQFEALSLRNEGAERVSEKAAALGEQIEALRTTLVQLERERTSELRNELRLLTRTLARGTTSDETQE